MLEPQFVLSSRGTQTLSSRMKGGASDWPLNPVDFLTVCAPECLNISTEWVLMAGWSISRCSWRGRHAVRRVQTVKLEGSGMRRLCDSKWELCEMKRMIGSIMKTWCTKFCIYLFKWVRLGVSLKYLQPVLTVIKRLKCKKGSELNSIGSLSQHLNLKINIVMFRKPKSPRHLKSFECSSLFSPNKPKAASHCTVQQSLHMSS